VNPPQVRFSDDLATLIIKGFVVDRVVTVDGPFVDVGNFIRDYKDSLKLSLVCKPMQDYLSGKRMLLYRPLDGNLNGWSDEELYERLDEELEQWLKPLVEQQLEEWVEGRVKEWVVAWLEQRVEQRVEQLGWFARQQLAWWSERRSEKSVEKRIEWRLEWWLGQWLEQWLEQPVEQQREQHLGHRLERQLEEWVGQRLEQRLKLCVGRWVEWRSEQPMEQQVEQRLEQLSKKSKKDQKKWLENGSVSQPRYKEDPLTTVGRTLVLDHHLEESPPIVKRGIPDSFHFLYQTLLDPMGQASKYQSSRNVFNPPNLAEAHEFETEEIQCFNLSIHQALKNRCFFTTSSGYIGLGPRDTRCGDYVAIFLGGNMPFVVKDESTHHSLVGEAYVHGIMDGELMMSLVELQEFHIK